MPIETPPQAGKGRLSVVRVPDLAASEPPVEAIRRGLSATPKTLPCQLFYDAEGSRLFEQICDLPEYYLTRTEDAILREHAEDMVSGWDAPPAMIELGSGSSKKTRRLIEAALEEYGSLDYFPIDVSPTILEQSARDLVRDYGTLRISGYAGDYRSALPVLAAKIRRPKLLVFLGSSLGNYERDEAADLLGHMARAMRREDRMILGTDLAKDRASLEAAYDDSQGVTAAFNRNVLVRLNREFGADFDPTRFRHEARYRDDLGRVEMHLVSSEAQSVRIAKADVTVRFAEGESIHTENSHKYTPERLADLAAGSGFEEEAVWTDGRGWFRVQRWRLLRGAVQQPDYKKPL